MTKTTSLQLYPLPNRYQNKIIDAKIVRYNDTKITNTFFEKTFFHFTDNLQAQVLSNFYSSYQGNMGEIFSRFPHVGIQILDNLNDKDLQRCCYVSHSWNNFVKSEKFWWMRIIKRITKELNPNYTDCPRIWRQMFKQIETETVKNFAKKLKLEHEMWETIYLDTPMRMMMRSHSFFKKTELITLVRNMHGTLDNESDKKSKKMTLDKHCSI